MTWVWSIKGGISKGCRLSLISAYYFGSWRLKSALGENKVFLQFALSCQASNQRYCSGLITFSYFLGQPGLTLAGELYGIGIYSCSHLLFCLIE